MKLKEGGQPCHKIIHVKESSLDAYCEITEDERRQLSHIASGYVAPKSSTSSSVNSVQAYMSTCTAFSSMESLQPATLPECVMT